MTPGPRSIYPTYWDPINQRLVSNNPARPGYTPSGAINLPIGPNAAGVNPWASYAGGYTPASLPGVGGSNPGKVSLDSVMAGGYNPTAAPGQGYNPFFTVSNTKSPDIAQQINDLLTRLNTLKSQDPTQMVAEAMKAADPAYRKYLEQETGAVGDWFNGVNEGRFSGLTDQMAAMVPEALRQGYDELSRQQALEQMRQGGAGTVGTSGWLQKAKADTASRMALQQAMAILAQRRADLGTVLTGQQQNLGTRAGLTTGDIQRQLMPSQVSAQWFNNLLAGLGPLAQMQLMNTFYGLGGGYNPTGTTVPYISPPAMPSVRAVPNSPVVIPPTYLPRYTQPVAEASPQRSIAPFYRQFYRTADPGQGSMTDLQWFAPPPEAYDLSPIYLPQNEGVLG